MRFSFLHFSFAMLLMLQVPDNFAQNASDSQQKIDELDHRAQAYLREQQPELAIPIFRQILLLDSQNVNARGNLGVLLFFKNEYPEAITEMRAALQLQPTLWRIEALLGIAEKRTGDFAAAQTDLENSFPHLDDLKVQKEAGLNLIEIAVAAGEFDRAAAIVAQLEKIAPLDPQVLFVSYQISLQMSDRALLGMMIAAPNSAELRMMMADQFVRQGDSENAIAQYRDAIRINSHLPGVHFELAAQLKDSSDPALKAEAELEFRTAISMNQFDEKAWRGLGESMAEKGDLKAAKEAYAKALALSPNDSDAGVDLAILLAGSGDATGAISLLENAVKVDPTNIGAHYQLSLLYRRAGKQMEAQHEKEEFDHYKALKGKLGKAFREIRQTYDQGIGNSQPLQN